MKPTDPALDAALAEAERRVRRLGRGRVFLTLQVLGGRVIGHEITEDRMTTEDVERVMVMRPRRGR